MGKTAYMKVKTPVVRYWDDDPFIVEYKEAGKKRPLGQCVKVAGGWYAYIFIPTGFSCRFEVELDNAKRYVEDQCLLLSQQKKS